MASSFRCGEYNNRHARSGLRLMRQDQRPFFLLAVQQAEGHYNIKAAQPQFFYWMQDPVAEMNSYQNDGYKMAMISTFFFFLLNSIIVISFSGFFSRLSKA